ncbi:MAG: DinB family protein [Chitinophagaceae bacterium]|nr:DinB family protein [Chitinophagaceae bacterium]
MNDLIDTWQIHNRINNYLLAAITDEALLLGIGRGRNAAEQFAHIHNVRLMWLKASAPELFATQTKIEKGENLSREFLTQRLNESGDAIASMLETALAAGKLKGFKPHPAAFLGYMISHESHHRGQITQSLKHAGYKIDAKVLYGLWEWGSR